MLLAPARIFLPLRRYRVSPVTQQMIVVVMVVMMMMMTAGEKHRRAWLGRSRSSIGRHRRRPCGPR